MTSVLVAVPRFVLFEGQLLIGLVVGERIGTIPDGSGDAGAVLGGDAGERFIGILLAHVLGAVGIVINLVRFVQVLVYQPGGGQVIGHVKIGLRQSLFENDVEIFEAGSRIAARL